MKDQYDNPSIGRYFSLSYSQGRKRFLAACGRMNAQVESFKHPDQFGPDGEALVTDVVRFGPANAARLGFFICGTHGLEAAAGAATFLHWLDNGGPQSLPPDVSIVLVHAINPYGWAHGTRGDEYNIDVNRNCFKRSMSLAQNENYRDLHPLLTGEDASASGLKRALAAFHRFCEQRGAGQGLEGFAAGQYEFPDGLSYGGTRDCWSYRTLIDIVRTYAGAAKKVVAIDWHTGIGDFGVPFIIVNPNSPGPAYDKGVACWGEAYVNADDIYGEGVTISHNGLVISAVENAMREAGINSVLSAVIEWGTYEIDTMFRALLIDRFLRSNAPVTKQDSAVLRQEAIQAFYPDDQLWRKSILTHAAQLHRRTIAYLSS
ncbi:DUF2817 domain-containing protein [Parasphingorhabdus sp.]|uniref:DUF2817 domain-containing protein n=1 Tax=Parasphingorhabdus sp. TaxID=2709688 RepID=UPI003263FB41